MNILILGLGGISRVFRHWPERTLGQALVKAGHHVRAITYHQPESPHLGLADQYEVIDGIEVYRVKPAFYQRSLPRLLASMPLPDVVHVLHPRNVLAWQALRWFKKRNVPIVWTWLGPLHDRWLVRDRERPLEEIPRYDHLLYRWQDIPRQIVQERRIREPIRNYLIHAPLKQADALIPCSEHEAKLMAQMGFGHVPTTVVPLWLDLDFIASVQETKLLEFSTPIILYIGQLAVRKAYDVLVEAMPTIIARYPRASFVFVTHNPEQRAMLNQMVRERGIEAHIHFLGTVSEEEKVALLRACDVYAFPTRYEGFGLPPLEAMAVGTPVVSTDVPAVNETITHNVNGLLACYDDPTDFAKAVLQILNDPTLRQRLVDGGYAALAERFQPEMLVQSVIAVYQECIKSKNQISETPVR